MDVAAEFLSAIINAFEANKRLAAWFNTEPFQVTLRTVSGPVR